MSYRDNSDNGNERLGLLFLQPQPCIRTLKYAMAFRHVFGNRISVSLAHMGHDLKTLYGYGEEYFDDVMKKNGKSIRSFVSDVIDRTQPDIVHSHNAPDFLTIAAIKAARRTPVVHDTHEMLSVHHSGFFSCDDAESLTRYALEEKEANERSDGRIYATDGIRRYIQGRYQVNAENDLVFLNYVSRRCLPNTFKRKLSEKDGEVHIAYVGCVTSLLRENHYYLLDIFKDLAHHKLHVHIHPTSNVITRSAEAYKKLAVRTKFVHYHGHMDRRRLLQKLTQYDYGWAGLNAVRNKEHLEIALPNKVVEYIACGLPVLAFPHKTISRFIQKKRVGVVGKNVDDIAKRLVSLDLSELRSNVEIHRQRLVIEERIRQIVGFYQQLIDRCA